MQVLYDRTGHGIEKHIDTNAGGKQHRNPGNELVLRTGVIGTETHVTFFGKCDPQHKTNDKCHRKNVIPAEIHCNPVNSALHRDSRMIGNKDGPDGKRKNND